MFTGFSYRLSGVKSRDTSRLFHIFDINESEIHRSLKMVYEQDSPRVSTACASLEKLTDLVGFVILLQNPSEC